jgi:hypothetical protein
VLGDDIAYVVGASQTVMREIVERHRQDGDDGKYLEDIWNGKSSAQHLWRDPGLLRLILIYARVGRQALAQGKPFAATGWFATGYLLAGSVSRLSLPRRSGRLSARPCSTP